MLNVTLRRATLYSCSNMPSIKLRLSRTQQSKQPVDKIRKSRFSGSLLFLSEVSKTCITLSQLSVQELSTSRGLFCGTGGSHHYVHVRVFQLTQTAAVAASGQPCTASRSQPLQQ